jgi:hypothetical protein
MADDAYAMDRACSGPVPFADLIGARYRTSPHDLTGGCWELDQGSPDEVIPQEFAWAEGLSANSTVAIRVSLENDRYHSLPVAARKVAQLVQWSGTEMQGCDNLPRFR